MGLYQFRLVQHTSSARKVLKARSDQHRFIAGDGNAPSLADAATLTAPYGVSLPATLSMVQGAYILMRVVLVILFRPDQPATLSIREVNT